MPTRKDIDTASRAAADTSAVERSLEDFIARANSTLPILDETTRPKARVADVKKRRQHTKPPASTLVVLGSPGPLADVTEIVSRVAVGTQPLPPRRVLGVRLGAAFLAGAAAVLLVSRVLVGGPKPQKPEPPPSVPAPVVTPVVTAIPIVVKPTVEPMPVAATIPAETPAPEVGAAQPDAIAAKPEPVAAKPARVKAPRPARPKAAAADVKKPKETESLVDPFAN